MFIFLQASEYLRLKLNHSLVEKMTFFVYPRGGHFGLNANYWISDVFFGRYKLRILKHLSTPLNYRILVRESNDIVLTKELRKANEEGAKAGGEELECTSDYDEEGFFKCMEDWAAGTFKEELKDIGKLSLSHSSLSVWTCRLRSSPSLAVHSGHSFWRQAALLYHPRRCRQRLECLLQCG